MFITQLHIADTSPDREQNAVEVTQLTEIVQLGLNDENGLKGYVRTVAHERNLLVNWQS